MSDIDWANPRRRRPATPITANANPRACAVCTNRVDVLICKECALNPAASIAWLESLPGLNVRPTQALELLRTL